MIIKLNAKPRAKFLIKLTFQILYQTSSTIFLFYFRHQYVKKMYFRNHTTFDLIKIPSFPKKTSLIATEN